MEQIGTYLQSDEAARSMIVAAVVYLVVAAYKSIRKGETDAEAAKFTTAATALVAAAVVTLLDIIGANGWSLSGLAVGPVIIRVLASWYGSMGLNSGVKRLLGGNAP